MTVRELKECISLLRAGEKFEAVAAAYHCSKGTLSYHLKKQNISKPRANGGAKERKN